MKGERKVETRQKVMRVIMIFALILNIANLATRPISHKEKFDKSIAEEILKEAYLPLIDFVKAGTPVEDEELLLVPKDIRSKNDFIKLFDNKIDNKSKQVEDFFEELVIEKQDVLYIDKRVYIPTIYDEDGTLTNSYIKKYKSSLYSRLLGENKILKEELIIKEKWKISGERRTNTFVMNENGQWVLDGFSGTSMNKFVDSNHNPWSYYWSYNSSASAFKRC